MKFNRQRPTAICLNGPPGSGKDTIAKIIAEEIDDYNNNIRSSSEMIRWRIDKFAAPINTIAASILGINEHSGEFRRLREKDKEQKLTTFGVDITMRQLLINISEDLIKPSFGKTWFGEQAARRVNNSISCKSNEVFLVSDSGFQHEYDAFKEAVHSSVKVQLVNVVRDNCDFTNDSREWVDDGDKITIENNSTIEHLRDNVIKDIWF